MRLLVVLLLLSGAARAAQIVDATGRTVTVPDHVTKILPAGPPAAVLLEVLAPDLLLGFPMDVSAEARAWLSPEVAALPKVPRLTGKQDVTEQVRALQPDLIVDYGDVTPEYAELARKTQERLGVPTILLDGALAKTPAAMSALGKLLHREERARALAAVAESSLGLGADLSPRRVMYLRRTDELRAVAPGVGVSEVFSSLRWTVLAPSGAGSFRPVTLEQIVALDPDVLLFADARMRGIVAASDAWRALRAVREGHAAIVPAVPFGWIEEPPSVNRLMGRMWLADDFVPSTSVVAAQIGSVLFGHMPTDGQLAALAESARPLPP